MAKKNEKKDEPNGVLLDVFIWLLVLKFTGWATMSWWVVTGPLWFIPVLTISSYLIAFVLGLAYCGYKFIVEIWRKK